MNKINRSTGNLLICIFEMLVGILLLINPVGFTSGIIIVFGLVLAVIGVVSLFKYFRADVEIAAQESGLAKGLVLTIFGIFCAFKSQWFLITFPVLTVIYGLFNLLTGIRKIQWAVDMLRMKQKYWFTALISAILTIIFAVLILANPFATTAILWTFISVTLLVEAIIDFLVFLMGRKQ